MKRFYLSLFVLLLIPSLSGIFSSAQLSYQHLSPNTLFTQNEKSPVKINILYLEDVSSMAEEAKKALEDSQTKMFHVTTKEEAIAILKSQPIDILLLDFNYSIFQGENGVTLAKEIIAREDIPFSGKIIFYSEGARDINRTIEHLKLESTLTEKHQYEIFLKHHKANQKTLAAIKQSITNHFSQEKDTVKEKHSTVIHTSS